MTASRPALVARDRELADLAHHVRRAGEAGARLVVVTGPPGVGRTALLDEAAGRHAGPVLRARSVPWEQDRAGSMLGQLLGREPRPDAAAAASDVVRRAVAAPGDEPALLLVDDAQWCDPESLRALSTACRHRPATPLLVVLAVADDRGPAGVRELVRQVAGHRLPLEPLGPRDVGRLAAERGVLLHASVAERLWAHTGGLPRHVVDLLTEVPRATWADFDPRLPAPSGVADRVRDALARVSGPARALAEAVAVLGPGATLREVVALTGTADLLPLVDEARTAGLVTRSGAGAGAALGPTDPMVAAAVVDAMGAAATAAAHRRAADVVDDEDLALGHLVAASPLPDPALADRLDDRARQRAAEGAWAAAATLFSDASRLTEDRLLREARLTRAVDALVGAGDGLAAAAMIPRIESLRETPERNAVLGYLAVITGRLVEAENRLGRAWELVNPTREPAVAASICQRYVLHALSRCRGEELVAWADRAVELVGPEAPAAVEAAAIRGLGVAAAGRPDEAASGYADLVERVRHGAQAQRVSMGAGWLDLVLDDVDGARSELERAVPTTWLGGSSRISLWARGWLARAQFVSGEWDDALRTVQAGVELLDRTGMALARPLLHWTAVQVHALRGDWAAAEAALRHAEATAQDYEIMRVPACLARAQVAEARADYAGVLRALAPLTQPWARGAIDEPGFWPWPDVWANALVIEGRYDEADAFLRDHERLARERGRRSARARLGYARGRLLGATGEVAAARRSFETSLDLVADLPFRVDRARINFAYGQTLRRAGKRREADAVITTAREIYAGLGATTYVERCDRELRAGGLHAPRGDRDSTGLTPQEEAVAGLVSRGLSNREVAAELYVSIKTVQYHLTRIYAKLGIRSRAELAALRGPTSGADDS